MLLKSSPIFTLQAPANATPTFTANILPVRAQAAYPVNASSRYWNSESMAQSTDVPANGPLGTGKQQETGTEDLEGENEGVEKTAKMAKSGYENEGLKISYFRGRRLLGREIGLGEMGYKGVLVSPTNTILPQSTDSHRINRPLEEQEEDDDESDEPSVQVLTKVGTIESVVVWDHEKVPGGEDLFLRGLGEEGRRWRAGMHAF